MRNYFHTGPLMGTQLRVVLFGLAFLFQLVAFLWSGKGIVPSLVVTWLTKTIGSTKGRKVRQKLASFLACSVMRVVGKGEKTVN